jgi:signal transduction histidine kinase
MHPLQLALSFSGLINGITAVAIGTVVIIRGWQNRKNRLFFFFMLSTAIWSLAYWRWLSIPADGDPAEALFWVRMLSVGSTLLPLFMVHWVVRFLNIKQRLLEYVLYISYAIAGVFLLFGFSPFYITEVTRESLFPFWPKAGWLYTLYILYFYIGFTAYAVYLLFKKYRSIKRSNTEERKIFLIVLMGIVVSFTSGFSNFPLWYGINVLPLGNFLVPTLMILYGYAIVRHNLFNIRTIMAEFSTIFLWSVLFVRFLMEARLKEKIIDGVVLAFVLATGTVFIRSVRNEVRQKEQLADLNENLEAKVAEQTKEIRRAYEVEKKARHELEELDKAKTDFILTTQHHLRTPLTVVKGVANMLVKKHSGDTLSDTDEAFIGKLDSGANKLAKLINEFLDISQMEVGKSILRKTPTNIHSLIEESLGELSHEIEQKQLRIETTFSDEAKETNISLDKSKIQSALINLLDNAVKYTPEEGRITITADITTHPIENKQQYEFTIKDSGIGMTPEEQTKAFTRSFERGTRAKELNATGRGIGLMLTKQIIESHGGTIELSSEGRDKGTTFTVMLPIE